MHRTRLYNTLIVLILMVSLLAPAPVLADDLPPEKAIPTGIIARFTTVEESPDPSTPRLAVGATGRWGRVRLPAGVHALHVPTKPSSRTSSAMRRLRSRPRASA